MARPTAEDERVADVIVETYTFPNGIRAAIASAIASEREKAAKIADGFQKAVDGETMPTLRAQYFTARAIAAAVRAGDN